ncbi:MAG TPA: sigma-70 family RNA polymerase sigma factor [Candidatus Baltobacteraceae bacterium]|nr:sigma-70 family RNA polymerase sigma factor [Candidatus Baltobacteraceae bacterium]
MIALEAELEIWLNERSRENRDRLFARYHYLCPRAARKFCRRGADRPDLEQMAAIGLLKACDRYDGRLQTPFEAFAWLFVVGELMHYVRDHERLVRAPRRLRDLERRYQQAHDAMVGEHNREPSMYEVAERLQLTMRDIGELALYRAQAVPESLDALEPHELQPCSYTLEQREDRLVAQAALACLTQTERTIILALYAKGYSQVELSERLGYSRRHISRLHRTALRKMLPLWVSKSA